jgi:exopolyphosphatase / guanosine-5'-triphosphate,3'-diphosphate pyrophosphatase
VPSEGVTRPTVGAAVDLGSNSVHLVVAAVVDHRLRPLIDESSFLGLGAAVDDRAHLGPEARSRLADLLGSYATKARDMGASTITLLGTEPLRRAADGARIVVDVERRAGVPLHVLTHEEEAFLTMIGVTSGFPVENETLVVDIGGGSSEFCAVGTVGIARAAGLRIGSNRLTTKFVTTDPPRPEAITAMRAAADDLLTGAIRSDPADLVVVGGTATNLIKVQTGAVERMLTRIRVAEVLDTLLSEPAAALTARFAINPKRGPLLPAGAVIVEALMRRYGLDRVRVSDASLREGAILAADHAGRAWRDRLPELARGWRG